MAIANRRESAHLACVNARRLLSPPIVTMFPVLTEALYPVARVGGWQLQRTLRKLVIRGAIEVGEAETDSSA